MECLRRLCCFKKYKIDLYEDDDEDLEFIPVQIINSVEKKVEPQSFFRSSVLSIYKKVDSVYNQVSEWSLPKKTHVNLFTLSSNDIDEYEKDDFYDDVVDEKF